MSETQIDPAALEAFILSQNQPFPMLPEWSVGQQEYQPMDIGSFAQNLTAQNNMSTGLSDILRAIMSHTFDWGTLEPVSSFNKEAPGTDFTNRYRNTGQYNELFAQLDAGMPASDAAFMQFATEFDENEVQKLKDLRQAGDKNNYHGRYQQLVELAGKIEPELAAMASWESQRDAAPTEMSENAKLFDKAGLRTTPYGDNELSTNIDQLRQDRVGTAADWDAAWADYAGLQNQWVEGPSIQGVGQQEISGDNVVPLTPNVPSGGAGAEALREEAAATGKPSPQNNGVGGFATEPFAKLLPGLQQFKDAMDARKAGQGADLPQVQPSSTAPSTSSTVPSPQGGGIPPFSAGPPAKLMPGLQQFAEAMEARKAGGVAGGVVGGAAPTVPSTIPSQNMQVPFNPETHYAPTNANTLPDFNGPKGGMPRGAEPSDGGPSDAEILELAEGMTDGGFNPLEWIPDPVKDAAELWSLPFSLPFRLAGGVMDRVSGQGADLMDRANRHVEGVAVQNTGVGGRGGARQRDRDLQNRLVRREPTAAERSKIRGSFSDRFEAELAAHVEEASIARQRERGAHPAFDQLMARYNSLYQGR
jgi:hypothetical protein